MRAWGFSVAEEEEPPDLRDKRGVPTLWNGMTTRDIFKSGILAKGAESEIQEYTQMIAALALRSWLYGTHFPNKVEPDSVILTARGSYSTLVYQQLLDGRLLAKHREFFLGTLKTLRIPPADLSIILLPEVEGQLERLRQRGEQAAHSDVYDSVQAQERVITDYQRITRKPDLYREISLATYGFPSAEIGDQSIGQLEMITSLMVLTAALMKKPFLGARHIGASGIVKIDPGSTVNNGSATIALEDLFGFMTERKERFVAAGVTLADEYPYLALLFLQNDSLVYRYERVNLTLDQLKVGCPILLGGLSLSWLGGQEFEFSWNEK